MSGTVLNEESVYDGADVPLNSVPIDQIRYVGFSVQPFKDISIINRMPCLEIVTFRLCGIQEFPSEFFNLPRLTSVDLSGNSITKLPGPSMWIKSRKIRYVNLSDNNISDINEIFKMKILTSLKQLQISGNTCLSANNAVNRIVTEFQQLLVLNNLIILSQYRSQIGQLSLPHPQATLPLTKTDEFFFLYVRYMHSGLNERYTRRSNVDFFCLNKVFRKYSAIEKIQSIWRGYNQRMKYQRLRKAAIFIKCLISFWYKRRVKAANIIRRAFRLHRFRQRVQFMQYVMLVQSVWRKKMARDSTIQIVFQAKHCYKFYIMPEHLDYLLQIIQNHSLDMPSQHENGKYQVMRYHGAKKNRLPGSPVIFYAHDNNVLIRRKWNNSISPQFSIWCNHNHDSMHPKAKVTKFGFNFSRKCPFASLKPEVVQEGNILNRIPMNKKRTLLLLKYTDGNQIYYLVNALLSENTSIQLFSSKSLRLVTAQLSIQSAMRTFLVRRKCFSEMKQSVIENRARNSIIQVYRSQRIFKLSLHLIKSIKFSANFPESTCFYVEERFLSSIVEKRIPFLGKIGFSADKTIVVEEDIGGFVSQHIPKGKIIIHSKDLLSIIRIGASITRAYPSYFSKFEHFNSQWIQKHSILKVSFRNPEETKRRCLLYSWLTSDFKSLMSEEGVVRYCCAMAIKRMWIGWTSRKTLYHLAHQAGRAINPLMFMRNYNSNKEKNVIKDSTINTHHPKNSQIDPRDAISVLRGEYSPWKQAYRTYKLKSRPEDQHPVNTSQLKNDEMLSSKKMVGLVQTDEIPTLMNTTSRLNSTPRMNYDGYSVKIQSPKIARPTYKRLNNTKQSFTHLENNDAKSTISQSIESNDTECMNYDSIPADRISSAQRSDKTMQTLVQSAFTRLVRLHQIGVTIQQAAVIDNTIEEKRAMTSLAREKLYSTREFVETQKETNLEFIIEQNNIENQERREEINEVRAKSQLHKTRNANKIRKDIAKNKEKYEINQAFAHGFISLSRKIAQTSEKIHRQMEERKQFEAQVGNISEKRTLEKQKRAELNEKLNQIKTTKQELAKYDYEQNEEKRAIQTSAAERRKESISRLKDVMKEQRAISKQEKRYSTITANPLPKAELDEVESSKLIIGSLVGSNMGFLESHYIAEIIYNIVNK